MFRLLKLAKRKIFHVVLRLLKLAKRNIVHVVLTFLVLVKRNIVHVVLTLLVLELSVTSFMLCSSDGSPSPGLYVIPFSRTQKCE